MGIVFGCSITGLYLMPGLQKYGDTKSIHRCSTGHFYGQGVYGSCLLLFLIYFDILNKAMHLWCQTWYVAYTHLAHGCPAVVITIMAQWCTYKNVFVCVYSYKTNQLYPNT